LSWRALPRRGPARGGRGGQRGGLRVGLAALQAEPLVDTGQAVPETAVGDRHRSHLGGDPELGHAAQEHLAVVADRMHLVRVEDGTGWSHRAVEGQLTCRAPGSAERPDRLPQPRCRLRHETANRQSGLKIHTAPSLVDAVSGDHLAGQYYGRPPLLE
jgi:hypothetical protein